MWLLILPRRLVSCIKHDRSTMLKISKITPMEIIIIVYFFTYYSCSCSFKSARCVLIVQSMHFGTAFTDCNSICQIEDGGHAFGAVTYHDVIRYNPNTGYVFWENPKTDLWSQIIRILHCQKNGRFVGKKDKKKKQHKLWMNVYEMFISVWNSNVSRIEYTP